MGVSIECPKCGYRQRDYSDLCKACKDQRKESGLSVDSRMCKECRTALCKKCNALLKTLDKVYWIDYYDSGGRRHRKKIGSQKTVAELALKDVKVKIAKGEYLGIYEEKKTLLKDFSKKYLKMVQPNLSPTSYARFEGIINNHLEKAFPCYLYKISKKQIQEYIQKRSEEVEPATINQETKRLRHMLNKAIEWGYLKENPCKGIKNMKEPSGRIRYLSRDEIDKLLKACDVSSLAENPNNKGRTFSKIITAYLKPIVQIAIHSGMRRGEIMNLRWKDIDFKERRIILEKTKNNERRAIPMNDTLYQVLQSLPVHLHAEKVFPDINGNMVTVTFKRACKRAGIEDFRFHDLRHSFASYLTMGGENLRTVQTLLGHKDLRMTMRYSHLSPEHLRDAVTTLERTLARSDKKEEEGGKCLSVAT
jgi:integrase